MSRREETTSTTRPRTNQENQFQTPDKPQATTSSGHSKKTFSSASSSSSSKRRNKSPFSSVSTSKFSNTPFFSSPSDQTTLTQIAFVTKPREPELDDGRFDYIEENEDSDRDGAQRDAIVIDSDSECQNENGNDNNNNDNFNNNTDFRLPRARRVRTVRFEEEGSSIGNSAGSRKDSVRKPRRTISTNPEVKRTGARRTNSNNKKSINYKNNNNRRKSKDNTLTQMKFVHPIIHIKSDGAEDDVNLDYISCSPRKNETKERHEPQSDDKVEGDLSQDTPPQHNYYGFKKRKTHDVLDRSSMHTSSHKPPAKVKKEDTTDTEELPPRNPITPQKFRKLEVPSSQSPESPGIALISPSQFRSSIRPPLKNMSPNAPTRHMRKEGSPTFRAQRKPSTLDSDHALTIGENTVSTSSMLLNSPLPGQSTVVENAGPNSSPKDQELSTESEPSTSVSNVGENHQIEDKSGAFERNIVYETDAESDYDDIGNESLGSSGSHQEQETIGTNQLPLNIAKDSLVNDSQGHHPPAVPFDDADLESGLPSSEAPMSSNASICYRRQQPSTQFPAEPIPNLNTQKIAELFPQENDTTDTSQFQPPPCTKPEPEPLPTSSSQTQSPTRSQAQSQDSGKLSTEIVPESSPVSQRDLNDSVVQVESSQPADRVSKQTDINQSSGPQGILSRGRLLPSSLMESIAVPVFWMGSQDSVGEQYNLPDG